MNSILSAFANRSGWRCLLAAVLTAALPIVSQATLIFDVGDHFDVSAANPGITLFLENDGSSELMISGADIFFVIQAGGPTVDTSGNPSLGLNLLTGPLFTGAEGLSQIAGTPFGNQSQAWALFNFGGFATIDGGEAVQLGTLTFNSFPENGSYGLDFSGTRFVNDQGAEITDFDLINGSVTVSVSPIPEPSTVVASVFLLTLAGFHTLRQRQDKGVAATNRSLILP